MAPRPPDILRKSHAHSEGKTRAQDKRALGEALEAALETSSTEPALLIDLDGVVYSGDEAVPGAAEALAWLKDNAVPHLLVSSTASESGAALVEKLAGLGIEVGVDAILTPADTASAWIEEHGRRRFDPSAFYAAALARLGATRDRCWIMGAGVAGAEESGIGVILVRAGKQGPGDLDRDVEPALVIESIAELPRRWHELHRPRKSGNL